MFRHSFAVIATAAFLFPGCAGTRSDLRDGVRPAEQAGAFSQEEFRAHHAEINEHLGHIDTMAQRLPSELPEKQRETMRFVTTFLQEHILTHAAEEEATLYPKADAKACSRFTQSMRYEHTVVGAWVKELRQIAEEPSPNVLAFVRRTQRLLGLLEAHFGAEEEVIVPAVANG